MLFTMKDYKYIFGVKFLENLKITLRDLTGLTGNIQVNSRKKFVNYVWQC